MTVWRSKLGSRKSRSCITTSLICKNSCSSVRPFRSVGGGTFCSLLPFLVPILLLVIDSLGNLGGKQLVLAADDAVLAYDDDGKDYDADENGKHTEQQVALTGVLGLLLYDGLLLLLFMIYGGQLLSGVLSLAALQCVLYLEHLFVECGGLTVSAHLAIHLGQTPFGGVHHLAQGVALLAHTVDQVVIDGGSLLIAAALLHIVNDEIVASVIALVLHGFPGFVGRIGLLIVLGLQAARG